MQGKCICENSGYSPVCGTETGFSWFLYESNEESIGVEISCEDSTICLRNWL